MASDGAAVDVIVFPWPFPGPPPPYRFDVVGEPRSFRVRALCHGALALGFQARLFVADAASPLPRALSVMNLAPLGRLCENRGAAPNASVARVAMDVSMLAGGMLCGDAALRLMLDRCAGSLPRCTALSFAGEKLGENCVPTAWMCVAGDWRSVAAASGAMV
jgi:hypothetical protein